jgi:excisionase family DNA binding protein
MEQFMTSEEIAELLHVDPVTIRRLVNKGELSAYRIGADYRFAPTDLQDYLQRHRIAAHTQNESCANPNHPLDQFAQLLRKIIQGKNTTSSELLNRFDRFTKRARHVLMLAQEEAQSFQHNAIGTEHLLLGLLREGEGVAAQVLNNLGIETDQVRHAVEAIVGRGEQIVRGEMALNPRTKKVFEFALDEAQRLNHHFIGTEHLLLGLIREGEGIAARVLKSLGLQLEQVRTEILRILHQHQQEQEQEQESTLPLVPSEATRLLAESEPGLTCTSCGAHCPDYFRYCFNCGQPLIREDARREEEG